VIRDGLEHELALDLEHIADLVESPGEVVVAQLVRGRHLHERDFGASLEAVVAVWGS